MHSSSTKLLQDHAAVTFEVAPNQPCFLSHRPLRLSLVLTLTLSLIPNISVTNSCPW